MTSALLWCWAPWPSSFFASHSIPEQIPLFMFFLECQTIIKVFSWLSYISPRALKLLLKLSMSAQRDTSYFWSMQNLSLVNSRWNFGDHQFWCIFKFHTLLFSFVSSSCLVHLHAWCFARTHGSHPLFTWLYI